MKAGELINELRHDGLLTDKVLASMSGKTLGVIRLRVGMYGAYVIASEDTTEYSVTTIGELLSRILKGLSEGYIHDGQTVMLGEMYGDSDDRRMRTHEIGHVEYSDGVFVIFAEDER